MKAFGLACLLGIIALSSHHQAVADEKTSQVRGVSSGRRKTQKTTVLDVNQESDQAHRRTKKSAGGGKGGSAKSNPCQDTATYSAAYDNISAQCTVAKTNIANGSASVTAQLGVYCPLLKTTDTAIPDGTFANAMVPVINNFCDPLKSQAAQADAAYNTLLNLQSSVLNAVSQQAALAQQAANLIAQCISIPGIVPADKTTVPPDCAATALAPFPTACP